MAERPEWLVVNRMRQEMGEGLLHTEKFVFFFFFCNQWGANERKVIWSHLCSRALW